MLKAIRVRIAESRFDRATGEAIDYSRRPAGQWHVTVQCALNARRDRLAQDYAAAIAS